MDSNTNETIQIGNNDMKQTKEMMMMIKGNRKGNKSIGNETKTIQIGNKHITYANEINMKGTNCQFIFILTCNVFMPCPNQTKKITR